MKTFLAGHAKKECTVFHRSHAESLRNKAAAPEITVWAQKRGETESGENRP